MSERLQMYSSKEDVLFLTDTINNSGSEMGFLSIWCECCFLRGVVCLWGFLFVLIERLVKVYENIVYFYMEDT